MLSPVPVEWFHSKWFVRFQKKVLGLGVFLSVPSTSSPNHPNDPNLVVSKVSHAIHLVH
jgi:hypothetical protein